LPIAVISRTLRLDPASALFSAGPGGARTIVLTTAAAPADRGAAIAQVAEVVVCGDDTVEPARVRAELERRGHTRILSEGGPTSFTDLAGAGVVDELCLSISPLVVGPGPGRILAGAGWPQPRLLTLAGLLEEDGALFLRYALG
jgi:riboflavin biosynthesis pyrimidine reductase